MENSFFDDDSYGENVLGSAENAGGKSPPSEALSCAHDVRKFEIGLFWTRGSYYWVFIAASFTAYLAAMNKFIGGGGLLDALMSLPFMEKIVLLILAAVSFLFSLSWVLVNKGSKFWQENWEAHIDTLEDKITGKLYKAILNTHGKEFRRNPLSHKAYDYSVTAVTTETSIMLTELTFALMLFHAALIFLKSLDTCTAKGLILLAVLTFIAWSAAKILRCTGNSENTGGSGKWFMRKSN